ncbi:flavoprotein [Nemania sp. FL0031]|nr:flavoprotein [Nemania sp. FL0031]
MGNTQQAETTTASSTSSSPHVIVVGGGLAGICAAISAAERGASVHVLDSAHGGGSSAISGGVIYAGGGTKEQIEAGYGDDTPDNMFLYLRQEVGDAVDEKTLRKFCDESVTRMEWLRGHGVMFSGSLCPFRTSYPTNQYFLYFSGNEKAYPFAKIAKPAPRGHRTVGMGSSGMGMTGGPLWETLFLSALRLGVRFEPASRVDGLLFDEDGKIEGVSYRALEQTAMGFAWHKFLTKKASQCHQMSMTSVAGWLDYLAHSIFDRGAIAKTLKSQATILAAGGFVMNQAMMSKYIPCADRVAPLGTAGDDGSGIQLGQTAGGSVSHMDRISIWRLMYPPEALLEGIVVSMSGERFAAEDLYGASLTHVMVTRFDGRAFLILDSVQWNKAKRQIREQTQMPWTLFIRYLVHWAHQRAGSIELLAQKLGVNPQSLSITIDAYNKAIADGKDDPMGKSEWKSTITEAPFYGIDISLRPSGLLVSPALTLGGLRVDGQSGAVLNERGDKIQGLYAAGKNAAGISSNSYVSGLALADCAFSGLRAGENAIKM